MTAQKKQDTPVKEENGQSMQRSSSSADTSKKGMILNLFSCIVATVALLSAAYVYLLNSKTEENRQAQMDVFKNRITQLKTQQALLNTALDNSEQALVETKQKFNQRLEQINHQLQQSLKQNFYEQDDWKLLKAQYYLELAQINAHWSKDSEASIALLAQADSILSHVNQKEIFEIRQQIAQEISQLKALEKLDIAGILSKIDAASAMVNELPQSIKFKDTNENTSSSAAEKKASEQSAWRQRLHESVNVLEKLVIIHKDDQQSRRLLSPMYAALIRDSIQLNLQQAQWAVLNRNEKVYEMTLNQTIDSTEKYFGAYKRTKALIQQLRELKALNIEPEYPEVQQSLLMLNQLIERSNNLSAENTGASSE